MKIIIKLLKLKIMHY